MVVLPVLVRFFQVACRRNREWHNELSKLQLPAVQPQLAEEPRRRGAPACVHSEPPRPARPSTPARPPVPSTPSLPVTLLLFLQAALEPKLLRLPQLLHRLAPLLLLRCRWLSSRRLRAASSPPSPPLVPAAVDAEALALVYASATFRQAPRGRMCRRRDGWRHRPVGDAGLPAARPQLTLGLSSAAEFGLKCKAWNLRRGWAGGPASSTRA